jgi:hypothetical protein
MQNQNLETVFARESAIRQKSIFRANVALYGSETNLLA